MNKLICGTRGSELALWQTDLVISKLIKLAESNPHTPKINFEIKKIRTTGDKRQTRARISSDDKKDWIIELEEQLLSKKIDFAVHSAKDVPIDIEPETTVMSITKRACPRDAFIFSDKLKSLNIKSIKDLPKNARIGTSSLRRSSQLLSTRDDLEIIPIRGNVRTRISKIELENLDAVILANAGLERLDIKADLYISKEEILPAMCQGTLCVQFLTERNDLTNIFKQIEDKETKFSFLFEREVVKELNADCSSALGVYIEDGNYNIRVIDPVNKEYHDFKSSISINKKLTSQVAEICEEIKPIAKKSWI